MPLVMRGVHEAYVMNVIARVQPAAADIVDQNVNLAQFTDCDPGDPGRCLRVVEASSQSQPFAAQRIDFRGCFLHFGDGAGNHRDVGAFPSVILGDGPSTVTATAGNQAVLPSSCTSPSHLYIGVAKREKLATGPGVPAEGTVRTGLPGWKLGVEPFVS